MLSEIQKEIELETMKLAIDRKEQVKSITNNISLEFHKEILELTNHIRRWREVDHLPRGRAATPERKAYKEMMDRIPAETLAENVIRAIFDASLTTDGDAPITYQTVVNNKLIQQRFKSLLPKEERAIPIQFKFASVDLLVSRTVKYLPSLFKDIVSKKQNISDSIEVTSAAQERLGKISIQEILTDVPMRCPPLPWTSVFHGGFLTAEMQRGNPLVGSRYHDYQELVAIDKSLQTNGEVLEAVNKMQNVAFSVDQNFVKYQRIIDDIRKTKIIELQAQVDRKTAEIDRLAEVLKATENLNTPIR